MNKVIIMGRLCKDPEMRQTQSGTPVASFTVAVDRVGKDNGTDFFNCVAWNKTAEFVVKWFPKGKMIAVVGRLQNRDWTDKEGKKRISTEIVAEEVSFCGDKAADKIADKHEEQAFAPVADDSDIPF